MKTIYKYNLMEAYVPGENPKVKVKGFIRILSVAEQNNEIIVYCYVDTGIERETLLEFIICGTGQSFDWGNKYEFLGTVKLSEGRWMWHIFYKEVKE